jgi:hypothetical protein
MAIVAPKLHPLIVARIITVDSLPSDRDRTRTGSVQNSESGNREAVNHEAHAREETPVQNSEARKGQNHDGARPRVNASQIAASRSMDTPPFPTESTNAIPGSSAKVAVMAERARRGQHLYHPDDATLEDVILSYDGFLPDAEGRFRRLVRILLRRAGPTRKRRK